MQRCLRHPVLRFLGVMLLCLFTASCSSSSDTPGPTAGGDTSTLSGAAVKGPIVDAVVQAFYFNDVGQLVEIVAQNAPVKTGANGVYQFLVDAAELAKINGPIILQTAGGTMYGAAAPVLSAVIADPSSLMHKGGNLASYMSAASSVAAELLKKLADTGVRPTREQAKAIIAQVEQELGVDLSENPLVPGTGVALVNDMLDQNLDLVKSALANNPAVNDYIDYLTANLSSASGKLDEFMADPFHAGMDIAAAFAGHYTELARIMGNPDAFRKLKLFPSSPFVSDDNATATTLNALVVNGQAKPVAGATISFLVTGGAATLTATQAVTNAQGLARVGIKSGTQGTVTIQATFVMQNGNTICSTTRVTVVPAAALQTQTYKDAANLLMMSLANCQGDMTAADVMTAVCTAVGITDMTGNNAAQVRAALMNHLNQFPCGTFSLDPPNTVVVNFNGAQQCGGITGAVRVTPSVNAGSVSWTVTYQNLQKGDFVVNGTATTTFTKNGNLLTATHASTNLSANGYQLNGTSSVTINLLTGLVATGTVNTALVFTYENAQATANANLLYDANLGFSGTVTIVMGEQTYNCVVTNVKIDPTCGIPTSGTMTINGFPLDFSQTTCENQTVLITLPVVGQVPISIETAVAYFTDMED